MSDTANQESGSLADAVSSRHGFRPQLQINAFKKSGWEYVADWSPPGGGCPYTSSSCGVVHVWRRPSSEGKGESRKALVCPRCEQAFSPILRFHKDVESRRERMKKLSEDFNRWYQQLDRADLLAAVQRRKITRLCHFTTLANLESIEREGFLFSGRELERRSITFQASDSDRYDQRADRVSCSVEYPNLRYLRRLGRTTGNVGNAFEVVLLLNPSLMASDKVFFCQVNAAEAGGRRVSFGLRAFEEMFAAEVKTDPLFGKSTTISRGQLHPESCPTYIQAEVLIPGPIEVEHIGAVVVKRRDDCLAVERIFKSSPTQGKPVFVNRDFFDLNVVENEVFGNGAAIKLNTAYGHNSSG